jgi:hypothetical protein
MRMPVRCPAFEALSSGCNELLSRGYFSSPRISSSSLFFQILRRVREGRRPTRLPGSFRHKHARGKLPEADTRRTAQVAIIDTFKVQVKRLLHGKKVLAFA